MWQAFPAIPRHSGWMTGYLDRIRSVGIVSGLPTIRNLMAASAFIGSERICAAHLHLHTQRHISSLEERDGLL
jgi:hypothetical protein